MLTSTCIGHIGGDAVCKTANGKEFTTFRVADTSKWTDASGNNHEETCWIDCVMQGKPNVIEYLKKGQLVYVTGSTSLRVYSSKKDRCLKAGLTINVRQLELLGSKSDDVPARLYRESDGQEVAVTKHFYAADMVRDEKAEEYIRLVSRSQASFVVDRNGWVSPIQDEKEPEPEQQ